MSHIKLLLLLASLSCLSLHCKKESEEDKLPPATMVGAQTIGCLMNGHAWPSEADKQDIDFLGSGYAKGIFELDCAVSPGWSTSRLSGVYMRVKYKIFGPGYYVIPFEGGINDAFNVVYKNVPYGSYYTQGGYAILNITRLDTINHYMAGTFEYNVYAFTKTDMVKVTKGRFDYKYN
ncbi:MAG: hypothetical protein K1X81_00850 [Bacteroidia bacterium]|nr:hypothetical protein [Bacteroidia bacterium]